MRWGCGGINTYAFLMFKQEEKMEKNLPYSIIIYEINFPKEASKTLKLMIIPRRRDQDNKGKICNRWRKPSSEPEAPQLFWRGIWNNCLTRNLEEVIGIDRREGEGCPPRPIEKSAMNMGGAAAAAVAIGVTNGSSSGSDATKDLNVYLLRKELQAK